MAVKKKKPVKKARKPQKRVYRAFVIATKDGKVLSKYFDSFPHTKLLEFRINESIKRNLKNVRMQNYHYMFEQLTCVVMSPASMTVELIGAATVTVTDVEEFVTTDTDPFIHY